MANPRFQPGQPEAGLGILITMAYLDRVLGPLDGDERDGWGRLMAAVAIGCLAGCVAVALGWMRARSPARPANFGFTDEDSNSVERN
jgi:hypothetical protein